MKRRFLSIVMCMFIASLCCLGKTPESKLYDRIGLCSSPDNGWLMKEAGGHSIEIGIAGFLMPERPDNEFLANAQKAQACPLPIRTANGFFPSDIRLVGPEVDYDRIERYTEVAMRRAADVGVKVAVLGSGTARKVPEGFPHEKALEQFTEVCRRVAPIAAKYNVVVVIEPLNRKETNLVNSVLEGLEIVKAVKHPNLQVLADLYHMAVENEGPESIIKAGKHLRHVHIAEKARRTAPGIEGDDFTPYFRALKKIRYKGSISLECGFPDMKKQLKPSVEEVKRQLHEVYD